MAYFTCSQAINAQIGEFGFSGAAGTVFQCDDGLWPSVQTILAAAGPTLVDTTADPTPAVPASTVAVKNTNLSGAVAYITGGTVTAIAIDGTATGLTGGTFRIPTGSTITLTYSVAPTWQWFAD